MSAYEEAVSRPSKIIYGSNNEHVNSEKLLLETLDEPRARVLTICGGADNFMSLLAQDQVRSVTCVDANPHQLALGHLKLALACSNMTAEEVINFLGMNQSLTYNSKRLDVYARLEPQLPKEVAKLFRDDLMYEVETGIAQFGGEINSLRYIQRMLTESGFPVDDIWNKTFDLENFERICRAGIGTPSELGKAAFMEDSYPETYKKMWEEVCFPRACSAIFQAATDAGFVKTFNKAIMLKGKYDLDTLPEWLLSPVREKVRNKRDKVTFVNCFIDKVQSDGDWKFDLISTSNLFDWVKIDAGVEILTTVADKLAPNGCMLVRMGFLDANNLIRHVPNVQLYDTSGTETTR